MRFFLFFACLTILAQTELIITDPKSTIPIGITRFCENGAPSSTLSEVITRNLQISGYFKVFPADSLIQRDTRCGSPDKVDARDWSALGINYAVTASIGLSAGNVEANLFLIDINKGVVLGKQYRSPQTLMRKVAHKFSNEILKFFTGRSGPFGSQIVYSTKIGRFKELAIIDMDGSNYRLLTNTKGLASSPSFGDQRRVVFADFRKGVPDVFIMHLDSLKIDQVTRTKIQEFSPIFWGQDRLLFAIATGRGGTDIVEATLSGNILRTIISGVGEINISPAIDYVNQFIYFTSDAAGSPQVYRLPFTGGLPSRVSFTGSNYCTSPAITKEGDKLAFVCRAEGGFNIFVSKPDGSEVRQITSYGRNEDPSWSPDGRYLVFSTTAARRVASLAIVREDGRGFSVISNPQGGGDFEPSWGPLEE